MRRRRVPRRNGAVLGGRLGLLGEVFFAVAWMAFAGYFFYTAVAGLINTVHIRVDGVRVTGTALHSRSQEISSTDSDGNTTTSTRYYATVRFRDRENRSRDAEIDGFFKAAKPVALIYLPGHPDSVRASSSIKASSLVWRVVEILFSLGFVIFGAAFFRTWFGSDL